MHRRARSLVQRLARVASQRLARQQRRLFPLTQIIIIIILISFIFLQ